MSITEDIRLKFPKEFIFGTATSSYQIEGAWNEDGKGLSIWDVFCEQAGKVLNGETGKVACDHYHRYSEDIDLIKELGVNAYRFSISWPRILPKGEGVVNKSGLLFYDKILDLLNENNIKPWITIYHWDLPQVLQEKGGWESPSIIQSFESYTKIIAEAFKDKVAGWYVLNEPFVSSFVGNAWGIHAPGKMSINDALKVAHHHMLAQGKAIIALRNIIPKNIPVGTVVNVSDQVTFHDTINKDQFLARIKALSNYWFLDPVFFGSYPDVEVKLPFKITPDDQELMKQKIDVLGLNYYSRSVWTPNQSTPHFQGNAIEETSFLTEKKWKIYPHGLYKLIEDISNRYGKIPIQITENGAAFQDVYRDGDPTIIQDDDRIYYLRDHLAEVYRAIKNGFNVNGYFYWSLLDNFEWADGYSMKFGLIEVDPKTLERIPKKSYYYYQDVIKNGGILYP